MQCKKLKITQNESITFSSGNRIRLENVSHRNIIRKRSILRYGNIDLLIANFMFYLMNAQSTPLHLHQRVFPRAQLWPSLFYAQQDNF